MNYLDALAKATLVAQRDNDLPDFLAVRIFALVDTLQRCAQLPEGLRDNLFGLREQVEQYDTYAQTGYIGMGVDNHILEGSIERLEARVKMEIQGKE